MTYYVGQRIRFEASIRDGEGRPLDPESITATVALETVLGPASSRTFSIGNGVERDAAGEFFLDYTLEEAGSLVVRWGSKATGYMERRYDVEEREDPIDEAARQVDTSRLEDEESRVDAEPAIDRDTMIAELRARGVAVDDNRSTAFISAMHTSYAGGHGDRVDADEAHRRRAARELERELAKGRDHHALYADRRARGT